MNCRSKKVLSLLLILLLVTGILPFAAGAAEGLTCSVEKEGGNITISGETFPDSLVSLLVTRTIDGSRSYLDQTSTGEDGAYSFNFALDGGDYRATVSCNGLHRQSDIKIKSSDTRTVTVRVEGASETKLPLTEISILAGETTLFEAIANALDSGHVDYEISNGLIHTIDGEEGWQWMVDNRGGMALPGTTLTGGEEIVLVDDQVWNPTITRLTVDPGSVEVGSEFTVTLEKLNGNSAFPVPGQLVVFNSEAKATDSAGQAGFTPRNQGSFSVTCEPVNDEKATENLIRPVPVTVTVTDEGGGETTPDEEVTVYVTIEGYQGKRVLNNDRVTTGIFDLEPYLNDGTGSSARPSNDWYADKFRRPVVAHAMVKALNENRISYDFQDYGWGLYFAMIDGDREKDYKDTSGWMYTKNGRMATGVQDEVIHDGDEIYFWFTVGGWDDPYDENLGENSENPYQEYEEVINNPEAGEEDVISAIDRMTKDLDNSAKNAETEEEVNQVAVNAGKAADIIGKGLTKVKSEDGLHKIAGYIIQIAKILENTAEKMRTAEGKKEAVASAQKVVDTTLQIIDKMKDGTKIVAVANDILAFTGKMLGIAEKEGAAELRKKAIQIAEKVVAKAGTERLSENEIQTTGNKVVANIDPAKLAARAENVTQKVQAMEQQLAENNLSTTKSLERKVVVEIPGTGVAEVETSLPAGTLDGVAAKGIGKVEIKTEVASFNITPGAFGEKAKGKNIVLGAKKINVAEIPADIRSQLPSNSLVVELTAKAGGENIGNFTEPVAVSMPYTPKENEDSAQITVFLLQEDGSVEPVGGQYDSVTGTVKFITSHFSKYFAKQSIKEFTDMDKYQWAEKTVEIMAGKGIIAGRTAGEFDPGADISRAEFITLVVRMLKYEADGSAQPLFKDVNRDKWYYAPVAAAWENGLIKDQLVQFDLDDPITRQEMAVIIATVLENKGYKPADKAELQAFTDREDIADWAAQPAALAIREGLIKGMDGGKFAPLENANRAQAAVMLYRLYTLFME